MNRACEIGDIGETILLTELKMRGLSVAIPFGHLDPFDLIVVTPDGVCLKVQVKVRGGKNGGDRFQFFVKNVESSDIYAFLLKDRWCFLTKEQIKSGLTVKNTISLNKKKVILDDFSLFGV